MQKNTEIPDGFVKNWTGLTKELGISRPTLSSMMKMPGNPGKSENGLYNIEKWQQFREKIVDETTAHRTLPKEVREELGKIRVRREKTLAEKEELLLEKLKNRLVEIVEVKSQWRTFWVYAMNLLRSMLSQHPKLTTAEAEQFFDDFTKTVIEYQTNLCKMEDHAESQSEI